MNQRELKDLIEFLIEKDITEFELERGDVKVRIRRGGEAAAAPQFVPMAGAPAPGPAPVAAVPPAPATGAPPVEEAGLHSVKSPIVGTFYESPSPGSPPFVKVGDTVEAGQVLCIIEAMKLMNEIEAEVAGSVAEIFVQNATPVEFGQPLFRIEPA